MKDLKTALLSTLAFGFICGLLYPAIVWAAAQLFFPWQANGSLLSDRTGKTIGSQLIGQLFTEEKYFHPRPSAAGSGYDANASGGTNLGPTNPKLALTVEDAVKSYRATNSLPDSIPLPADAVTKSASGLDPEISPANARLQADRVAKVRGLSLEQVQNLIDGATTNRYLGIFGEPRVNVFKLNQSLDEKYQ